MWWKEHYATSQRTSIIYIVIHFFNSFEISNGFHYGIFICLFLPTHLTHSLLLTFILYLQSLPILISSPSPCTSQGFYHHLLTSLPLRSLFFHGLLLSFMTHTPSIYRHTLNLGSAYEKKHELFAFVGLDYFT